MHKVWLIARREYLERIRTKAFIVTTILIPLLMAGFLFGSHYMDTKNRSSIAHITIVSADTQLALDLQKELETSKENKIIVDLISPPGPDTRKILEDELEDKSTRRLPLGHSAHHIQCGLRPSCTTPAPRAPTTPGPPSSAPFRPF